MLSHLFPSSCKSRKCDGGLRRQDPAVGARSALFDIDVDLYLDDKMHIAHFTVFRFRLISSNLINVT